MASIINSHFGANVEKIRVQRTGKFCENQSTRTESSFKNQARKTTIILVKEQDVY
ncbi:hypothetical protein PL8927_790154 [Planktothrix serta PCC 8927]|uniref:Uncharacterized protein n=1 Tax=Planktothrix serta PCC 8927 TaxID=671068 RepID=A0A7Z9E576_9CYAN|nr:hypothetical protein PL8927_1020001 [Planktothrix serta PCC 8927]VXD24058.1 hypothetical protein PL8927_790154 [Planktothrix serta PCC 8927]